MAHGRVGDLLKALGKLAKAKSEYEKDLAISRNLVELDPSNANWKWDLAITLSKIAKLEAKESRHVTALSYYEEASRILHVLTMTAPDSVTWKKEKERINSEMAICRLMMEQSQSRGLFLPKSPSKKMGT